MAVHDRLAVGERQVHETGAARTRLRRRRVFCGQTLRTAEKTVLTSAVRIALEVVRPSLVEHPIDDVPDLGKRHRLDQLGVCADDQNGRFRGDFVQRLNPHLQSRDVPSEQVLGSVVQLERGEIDEQKVEIDVDVPTEVVEDVVGQHQCADVTRRRLVTSHVELVNFEAGRGQLTQVLLAQPLLVLQRLDERRLARVRLAEHGYRYISRAASPTSGNADATVAAAVAASVHQEVLEFQMRYQLRPVASGEPRFQHKVKIFEQEEPG